MCSSIVCALTPLEESIQREPGAHLWWTRPSLSVSTVQRREAWPAPEGMSSSNISGGFQACTLLLLRVIYDIFCLHLSLFITVSVSFYTVGDFSAFPFITVIHLFFIAQNLDSCWDEHVRIRASKQMDQCLKSSSFIFRVNCLVIPTAKKRGGSFAAWRSQFWFLWSSTKFKTTLNVITIQSSVVHYLRIIWSG